jgi:hypothetical protein
MKHQHRGPLPRSLPAAPTASPLRAERLVGMIDTYESALAELRSWEDPTVADLTARLEALQSEALEQRRKLDGAFQVGRFELGEQELSVDRDRQGWELTLNGRAARNRFLDAALAELTGRPADINLVIKILEAER